MNQVAKVAPACHSSVSGANAHHKIPYATTIIIAVAWEVNTPSFVKLFRNENLVSSLTARLPILLTVHVNVP